MYNPKVSLPVTSIDISSSNSPPTACASAGAPSMRKVLSVLTIAAARSACSLADAALFVAFSSAFTAVVLLASAASALAAALVSDALAAEASEAALLSEVFAALAELAAALWLLAAAFWLDAAALALFAAALWLLAAALALLVAFSSRALIRACAAFKSCSVGMRVTASRMMPHRASSSRVSVMLPAVIAVLPAGRVTSARQRSYTVAVREMAGAVGWVSGVPCRMSRELFRLAASNRRTMRSMRQGEGQGLRLPHDDAVPLEPRGPDPALPGAHGHFDAACGRDRKVLLGAVHAGGAGGVVACCVAGVVVDAVEGIGRDCAQNIPP